MKAIKKIFSIVLLLVAACQFQQALAAEHPGLPVYQDVISQLSLEYNEAMLNGDISLQGGALMHIIDYKTRDDNAMNEWRAGDVIVFQPAVTKDKLILTANRIVEGKVDDAVEPYVIFDNINSPKSSLQISEVRDSGRFIKLSDDSVWEFGFYNQFSTQNWSVGERVLVSGNGDKNSYHFINLDVPVKQYSPTATASFVVN